MVEKLVKILIERFTTITWALQNILGRSGQPSGVLFFALWPLYIYQDEYQQVIFL